MKTKLLSFAFTILTVCALWSQDATVDGPSPQTIGGRPHRFQKPVRSAATSTPPPSDTLDHRPIHFPFWMVKRIALDLEEKSRLEAEVQLLDLELQAHNLLVAGLQENNQRKDLQLELSRKQLAMLELQLKSEKTAKPKHQFLQQGLHLLGALGAGFVLGRL